MHNNKNNNPTSGHQLLVIAGAKAAAGSATRTPHVNKRSFLFGRVALLVRLCRGGERSEHGPEAGNNGAANAAGSQSPRPNPAVGSLQLGSSYPAYRHQSGGSYLTYSRKPGRIYPTVTPQLARGGLTPAAGKVRASIRKSTGRVVT